MISYNVFALKNCVTNPQAGKRAGWAVLEFWWLCTNDQNADGTGGWTGTTSGGCIWTSYSNQDQRILGTVADTQTCAENGNCYSTIWHDEVCVNPQRSHNYEPLAEYYQRQLWDYATNPQFSPLFINTQDTVAYVAFVAEKQQNPQMCPASGITAATQPTLFWGSWVAAGGFDNRHSIGTPITRAIKAGYDGFVPDSYGRCLTYQ